MTDIIESMAVFALFNVCKVDITCVIFYLCCKWEKILLEHDQGPFKFRGALR